MNQSNTPSSKQTRMKYSAFRNSVPLRLAYYPARSRCIDRRDRRQRNTRLVSFIRTVLANWRTGTTGARCPWAAVSFHFWKLVAVNTFHTFPFLLELDQGSSVPFDSATVPQLYHIRARPAGRLKDHALLSAVFHPDYVTGL